MSQTAPGTTVYATRAIYTKAWGDYPEELYASAGTPLVIMGPVKSKNYIAVRRPEAVLGMGVPVDALSTNPPESGKEKS